MMDATRNLHECTKITFILNSCLSFWHVKSTTRLQRVKTKKELPPEKEKPYTKYKPYSKHLVLD